MYFSKSLSYEVYTPPEPPADPGLVSYGYLVERLKPSYEKEKTVLYGHIDRLVVQNKDCDEKYEYVKTDGCGSCGNCPCTCHKQHHGGKLSKLFSRGSHDVTDFRYDKTIGRVRKKRFVPNLKNNKKNVNYNKKYRSADDDTLLQLSFFKKTPFAPKPKTDPCASYKYTSCGRRGPDCPECYNCTCVPVKDAHHHNKDMDEMVSAALDSNFVIPDKYDPIMRQEVSVEPLQYTDQSMADYQRLTKILQQQTDLDPKYMGGLMSPPPAKQTQELIKLLIDLVDSKQDVRAYQQSNSFQNPHDWMYVVDTDSPAYKVGKQQYLDILPLNQLEHHQKVNYIDDRPKVNLQMPAREPPKPLYGKIDTAAELYKTFQQHSPISVQQLLVPVNQILDVQAKNQVKDEKRLEKFLKVFKVRRNAEIIENKTLSNSKNTPSRNHMPTELGDEENYTNKLNNLYRKYKNILKDIENQKVPSQTPTTRILKVIKSDDTKFSKNKTLPKFVVLKQDSGVLLGDEEASKASSKELDSEFSERYDDDGEFVS